MPFGATPSRWCVCQFHHFRFKINNLSSIKTSANNQQPNAVFADAYEGAAQPVPDIVPDNLQQSLTPMM
jgi:hypothetical protein